MNKKTLGISILAIALLGMATNAFASANLNLSKSNINKVIPDDAVLVSATVDLSTAETRTLYTTKASGDFVLTNFCASPVPNGGMTLAADGFGRIARTTANDGCYSFSPGIITPRGAAITCSDGAAQGQTARGTGSPYFCTIAGFYRP